MQYFLLLRKIYLSFLFLLTTTLGQASNVSVKEETENYKNNVNRIYYTGLSIDGGGARVLATALMLEKIEEEAKNYARQEYNEEYQLHELFDYIGGTSIGGLLAINIVAPSNESKSKSRSITEWRHDFQKNIAKIIPQRGFFSSTYNAVSSILRPYYHNTSYKEFLGNVYREKELKDVLADLVIPSIDLNTMQPHIFTKTAAKYNPEENFYLKDVTQATIAMPSIFPVSSISPVNMEDKKYALIDGTVCTNNPSQLVFNRIQNKFKGTLSSPRATHKNTLILSLGDSGYETTDTKSNPGILHLALKSRIAKHLIIAGSSNVNEDMKFLLDSNYMRLEPVFDREKSTLKPLLKNGKVTVNYDDTSKKTTDILTEYNNYNTSLKGDIKDIARKLVDIKRKKEKEKATSK